MGSRGNPLYNSSQIDDPAEDFNRLWMFYHGNKNLVLIKSLTVPGAL